MRTLVFGLSLVAGFSTSVSAESEPSQREWTIEGVKREGLIYAPSKPADGPAPLVFGFHGHGGGMRNAARSFEIHKAWPEAIVVYLQGLPTPGITDPEGKKNGWQKTAGDQNDRDLKLFDAALKSLKESHRVDERRIYAMGHSNGGGFTYLLWSTRADVFAAVAPSAAGGRNLLKLKPLPCLHIAGEKDELVPFAVQKLVMQAVRRANGCSEKGTEWSRYGTLYESEKGAPFVALIHPGTHKYPDDVAPLIVRFFREHPKKDDALPDSPEARAKP